jgi:ribose 5-phosphate isomerase RpiB
MAQLSRSKNANVMIITGGMNTIWNAESIVEMIITVWSIQIRMLNNAIALITLCGN